MYKQDLVLNNLQGFDIPSNLTKGYRPESK